ncbi:MAG: AbrB/MazE/SpoVT family DNA-binding domain-containing protein [Clostridia bacterium]|nr:AbrB/MazE/SpoVT family DNA-binding domain-containing protein [Clostridia bacterium]
MTLKSTGIVRDVDSLGRVVLPKELRDTMHIAQKDPLEIYVEGDSIILRKYEPACLFCGSASNVISFNDRKICKECLAEMNRISNEG